MEFHHREKADANYRVTSAASIIAKQTRDMQIAQWEWQEPTVAALGLDKNFGSGYPGDPPCVDWMKDRLSSSLYLPQSSPFLLVNHSKLPRGEQGMLRSSGNATKMMPRVRQP